MSAYICEREIFDGIVSFAYREKFIEPRMCITTARILHDENVRAVSHRYGERDDLPGNTDPYRFRIVPLDETPSPDRVFAMLSELKYQMAEPDDYEETPAWQICQLISACTALRYPEGAPVAEPEPEPARDWTDLDSSYFQTNKPDRKGDDGGTKVENPTRPPVVPPAPVQQVEFADLF